MPVHSGWRSPAAHAIQHRDAIVHRSMQRYIVRLEVFAADGNIDLDAQVSEDPTTAISDLVRDLAKANPDEVEDQTYRMLRFDLCDACRRDLLAKPLG